MRRACFDGVKDGAAGGRLADQPAQEGIHAGRRGVSDTTRSMLIIRRPPRLQKAFVADYLDRYKEAPHWEADRGVFALATYKAGVEAAQKAASKWPDAGAGGARRCPAWRSKASAARARFRKDKIAEQVFLSGPVHQHQQIRFSDAGVDRHFPG